MNTKQRNQPLVDEDEAIKQVLRDKYFRWLDESDDVYYTVLFDTNVSLEVPVSQSISDRLPSSLLDSDGDGTGGLTEHTVCVQGASAGCMEWLTSRNGDGFGYGFYHGRGSQS